MRRAGPLPTALASALAFLPLLLGASPAWAVPPPDQAEELVADLLWTLQEGGAPGADLSSRVASPPLLAALKDPSSELHRTLRRAGGVSGTRVGPRTVRVLVASEPPLSILVDEGPDGEPVIEQIQPTLCTDCSEAAQAALWLHHRLGTASAGTPWALPGVDICLPSAQAHALTGILDRWLHEQDGALLPLARATAEPTPTGLQLQLPGGRVETWTMVSGPHGWCLDYDALPERSPLRMSGSDQRNMQKTSRRRDRRLQQWMPALRTSPRHGGLLVGEEVVDALPGPNQVTLLLMSRDTSLLGLAHLSSVDHSLQASEVLPSPGRRAQLPVSRRFDQLGSLAVHPTTGALLVAHLHGVFLRPSARASFQQLSRLAGVNQLGWDASTGSWFGLDAAGRVVRDGRRPSGLPISRWLYVQDGRVHLLTHSGHLELRDETQDLLRRSLPCHGDARTAAFDGVRGEWMVPCGPSAAATWEWVPEVEGPSSAVGHHGGPGLAAALDPSGQWVVTPSSDAPGLTLWHRGFQMPVKTVHLEQEVARIWFTSQGTALYALTTGGRLWYWRLSELFDPSPERAP